MSIYIASKEELQQNTRMPSASLSLKPSESSYFGSYIFKRTLTFGVLFLPTSEGV